MAEQRRDHAQPVTPLPRPHLLIVEQKVRKVLTIADHVYSLKLGKVAFSCPAASLADDKVKLKELFL